MSGPTGQDAVLAVSTSKFVGPNHISKRRSLGLVPPSKRSLGKASTVIAKPDGRKLSSEPLQQDVNTPPVVLTSKFVGPNHISKRRSLGLVPPPKRAQPDSATKADKPQPPSEETKPKRKSLPVVPTSKFVGPNHISRQRSLGIAPPSKRAMGASAPTPPQLQEQSTKTPKLARKSLPAPTTSKFVGPSHISKRRSLGLIPVPRRAVPKTITTPGQQRTAAQETASLPGKPKSKFVGPNHISNQRRLGIAPAPKRVPHQKDTVEQKTLIKPPKLENKPDSTSSTSKFVGPNHISKQRSLGVTRMLPRVLVTPAAVNLPPIQPPVATRPLGPATGKHRLTLNQLTSYDDVLTDALVDHVSACSSIRLHC